MKQRFSRCWSLLTFVVLLFVSACSHAAQTPGRDYAELGIAGEKSRHGIYDPSLEYAGHQGWLAYSRIAMPQVSTGLAKTADQGASWIFVEEVNPSFQGTISAQGRQVKGVWRNEVASLVHDPDDPGREWKLFWNKYFTAEPFQDKDKRYDHGWIGYRFASRPEGPWSEESKLFAAGKFLAADHQVAVDLNRLHPDLAEFLVFTEPGAFYRDGVLYLSLEGSRNPAGLGDWESRKIFLLASRDHGRSWQYVGPLTGYQEARQLGYVTFTASTLFAVKDETFLMVTPSGALNKSHKHADGMYVFKFADLEKGRLTRDANGDLVVHDYIEPLAEVSRRAGQGDYDEHNIRGGIVMGQINVPNALTMLLKQGDVVIFRLFNMRQSIR